MFGLGENQEIVRLGLNRALRRTETIPANRGSARA